MCILLKSIIIPIFVEERENSCPVLAKPPTLWQKTKFSPLAFASLHALPKPN